MLHNNTKSKNMPLVIYAVLLIIAIVAMIALKRCGNKGAIYSPTGGGARMISYYSDLRYKEVIDVHTGFRLGYVCDAEFDDKEGRLISLITPGRSKLFGLLGREDDYVLPWTAIVRIGTDIILVDIQDKCSRRKRPRRGLF